MKPTSPAKHSAEALAVYEKMIGVLLYFGPIEDLDEVVHPNFMGYGTAAHEFFKDLGDVKIMAQMQAAQLRDMNYTLTRKPVCSKLMDEGSTYLVLEDFELHIQDDDHELSLRLSTILHKVSDKWVITHFHGSTPDSNIDEDEALPMEGLRKKNLELEAKIRERTRELEIEAALERVRARSMAMHKTEEILEVVVVLFNQLRNLNIEFIQAWISIWYLEEGYLDLWMSPIEGFGDMPIYHRRPSAEFEDTTIKTWKKGDRFSYLSLKGGDTVTAFLEDMDRMLESDYFGRLHQINQYDRLEFVDANHKFGTVSMSWHEDVSEQNKEVLYRFAKVFEQTYTRFLDLQKAEAQAREAQIEAALERVRARSMAMHNTSELQEVINTVYRQFLELKVDITGGAFIAINSDIKNEIVCWGAGGTAEYVQSVHLPFMDMPIYTELIEGIKKGPGFFTESFTHQEKQQFFKELFKNPPYSESDESRKKELLSRPGGYTRSCVVNKHTSIFIINHHGQPFSDGDNDILKRMGKVFEQTYTRFLDLQQAEAQAREAQINLAVERVRAKALAMHRSEEIMEVVAALKNEVMSLEIPDVIAATIFLEAGENKVRMWDLSSLEKDNNGYEVPFDITFKLKKRDPHLYVKRVWENQEDYFFEEQDHKDFTRIIAWLREQDKGEIADEIKAFIEETQLSRLHHAVKKLNNGKLAIDLLNAPPVEMKAILTKMGAAFDLAYRRFEDLKKAEAQARESQIQLSLERIRSRAMAMHSTEELGDVLCVLFEQFDFLGIDPVLTHLTLFDEANDNFSLRITTSPKNKVLAEQILDVEAVESWKVSYENWKKGGEYTVDCIEYPRESLEAVWEVMHEVMSSLPKQYKIYPKDFPDGLYTTQGHCKYGYIGMNHRRPATEEEKAIVARFAREFGVVYQRFLELKKAETQAREMEIELALERVRARTMAMHKSEELAETALVLYQQFAELGNIPDRMSIGFFKEETGEVSLWPTDQSGRPINKRFSSYWANSRVMTKMHKSWKAGDDSMVEDLSGKNLEVWLKFIREEMKLFVDGTHIKGRRVQQAAFFSDGFLLLTTNEPVPDETLQLLIRFARVFSQTYTRFLDLLKAEAQAREAQIEAALERVRAKAMAMHNTEDIGITVTTFFNELLGLHPDSSLRCGIGILSQSENMELWTASVKEKSETVLHSGTLDMSLHPLLSGVKKAWSNHDRTFSYVLDGKDVKTYFGILNKAPDYPVKFDLNALPATVYHNSFEFRDGMLFAFTEAPLQDDIRSVLERFASVFGQTYTRYLDLHKAEAQAREAQIEAALEKVRSQSLAMHSTDEMQQVANSVYEQLKELGVVMDAVGMSGVIQVKQDYDVWVGGAPFGKALRIPYNEDTKVQRDYNKAIGERTDLFANTYTGKVKEEYINHLLTHGRFPKALEKKMKISEAFSTSIAFAKNSSIQIVRYTNEPYSQEDNDVLKRFAQVFEQAYIRFRDLQKAEAQAREAQIEAALERVRARSMGMQSSDELSDVLSVLFRQFDFLGIAPKTAWLTLWNPEDNTFTYRSTGTSGNRIQGQQILDIHGMDIWKALYEKWKTDTSNAVEVLFYPQEDLKQLFQLLDQTYSLMPEEERLTADQFPEGGYSVQGHCKFGYIGYTHTREPTEEECEILTRFATEFGRVYQRFLDIEKAEAQAREARIEVALERVRAKSLAMQSSDELHEVLAVLFRQFDDLGIQPVNVFLSLFDRKERTLTYRASGKSGKRMPGKQVVEVDSMEVLRALYDKWLNDNSDTVEVIFYPKEVLPQLFGIFSETFSSMPENDRMGPADFPEGGYSIAGYTPFGYLGYDHQRKATEEEQEILSRFCTEFTRVYQRFLDLQKAEAQAREAEIQLAMERIRAKTMAMQESGELTDVLSVIFQQLKVLGVETVWTHLTLVHLEENAFTYRMTGRNGERIIAEEKISLDASEHWAHISDALKSQDKDPDPITRFEVPVEGLDAIWELFDGIFSKLPEGEKVSPADFPDGLYTTQAYCKFGFLGINHTRESTQEEADILLRFTTEFSSLYQRFLDLQNAENRAREAQVEAALERIRAHVTGMQESSELLDIVVTMRSEFIRLGHAAHYFWHMRWLPDIYQKAMTSGDGTRIGMVMQLPRHIHGEIPLLAKWEKSKEPTVVYAMDAETAVNYVDKMVSLGDFQQVDPQSPSADDIRHIGGLTFVMARTTHGEIGYSLPGVVSDPPAEDIKTLVRFASAFDLAYKRFEDLVKAESRAREAVKQASIDRIRGQIASMRSTKDLERITPLIWNELTVLGVPFIRCGVFIIHEDTKTIDTYLSAPDGHALGVMKLDFDAGDVTRKTVSHWKKKEIFQPKWTAEEFAQWTDSLLQTGKISDRKTYQDQDRPPEMLYLNFVPFTQGMLYVGNTEPLEAESLQLIQSLAEAFAFAYARYEDFTQLEKAKERIERALGELKETQKQLVHSEKMASLGELTAGIAHEIQNPLNFVNNFSDVSVELIEEIKEEMLKGDIEEARAILEDIRQNLGKINHHGKRADGIVKGMLQHSRSSDGKKEPTDLNLLADEYLRLAYHGLRAKDKSFNATLETQFDESLGKVNVVPQEIGRVILNLITNAFHVVKEKKEKTGDGYTPTVSVITRKREKQVEIVVKDNGNGIPEGIREKIFQPFFTTKPTGQGTGLGLSMSYDIVTKGHGGEIKVNTKLGEGTTFTIQIPVN